jgi:hypothetical protein
MPTNWKWQYVDENGTEMGWFTADEKRQFIRNYPADSGTWRELSSEEVESFRRHLGQLAYEQA